MYIRNQYVENEKFIFFEDVFLKDPNPIVPMQLGDKYWSFVYRLKYDMIKNGLGMRKITKIISDFNVEVMLFKARNLTWEEINSLDDITSKVRE